MADTARVHATAIVDPGAKLADDVTVGPYAIIEGGVEIGLGSEILAHTIIEGPTIIGQACRIGPGAFIGRPPQHLRFVPDASNPTYLIIGDNVTIREGARIHRSYKPGKENATRIGDRCFLMGATHVGHDSVLGPDVIMADGVLLGGHVTVGSNVFLGGGCVVHQFVRIGRYAIISGNEAISQDVPPFAAARYGRLKGYNAVACRRAGFTRNAIRAIRGCYYRLRQSRLMSDAVMAIKRDYADVPEVHEIVSFIAGSKRGVLPSGWRGTLQVSPLESDE